MWQLAKKIRSTFKDMNLPVPEYASAFLVENEENGENRNEFGIISP